MSSLADTSGRADAQEVRAGVSVRIVTAYAVGVALLLGVVELQPKAGADAALLAPPWSSSAATAALVARADGDIVGATRWPFVIVARPRSPRFTAAAYAHGAWFVFDPGVLAGCRQSPPATAVSQ